MRTLRSWKWGSGAAVAAAMATLGACQLVIGYQAALPEVCTPGSTQPCQGTGTQTCSDDGTAWGACMVPPPQPQCTADNAATACDDKNACTADSCAGGMCQHMPVAAGMACGMGGSCDAMGTCLDGAVVWSQLYGDMGDATLKGLAVDGVGNVFVGGTFTNTITFGGMKLSAKSTTGGDGFLAKLKPDGTTAWAKSFGFIGQVAHVDHLTVDASGRVTFAGLLSTSFDFGCGVLNVSTTTGSYLAQVDGMGTCLWNRWYDNTNSLSFGVNALAIDPASNDVLVAGPFNGMIDVGASAGAFTANGTDIFVTRLHSGPSSMGGGSTVWATQLTGMTMGYRSPAAIAVRPDGLIALVGQLRGDLGGVVSTAKPGGPGDDLLYAKLDSKGNFIEAKSYGDGNEERPAAISVDPGSDTLFTGFITGSVDFGQGPLKTAGTNDKNTFLVKDAPNFLVYAKEWGDNSQDFASSVVTDKDSNIVLAGATLGTINFGGMDLTNTGQGLYYLAKLTPAAKNIWSKGFGDATTQVQGNPFVAVDPMTQQVIFGATYSGTLDVGNGKMTAVGQNFVVAKFSP
jgi:hypothetical protein